MFKIGDKVRVIKYGHPIFYNKVEYYKMQEYFHYTPTFTETLMGIEDIIREAYKPAIPKYLISSTENSYTVDISPKVVGQEGIIDNVSGNQYSISGIKGKHAWYNEEQLELII